MKEKKSKKKEEKEIEITNYMDDFDDKEETNEDEVKKEKNTIEEQNEEPIEETPIEEKEIEYTEEDLIPEVEKEDVEERFEGSLDDIEVDEHVNTEILSKTNKEEKKVHKRYRLKKSAYILLLLIIIIIITIVCLIKRYNYMHSNEYYLLEKGYTEAEVNEILASDDLTTLFLKRDYNKNLLSLMKEKYYLSKNLDKYLEYIAKHEDKSLSDVVTIINVGLDRDWYDDATVTDTTKNELMLVNKFHYLEEDYEIDDLVEMSVRYAFSGRKLRSEAYNAFVEMANAAKEENLTIVAYTTYRTYAYQETQYNRYKNQKGLAYADSKAARPGYSDHQTGLGVDISTLDSTIDFETTDEYTWLLNNAYKYGYILRYPKDKENITGFSYEPYHYRYVGKEAAAVIYRENITFEEYYAYYVEGNN